MVIHKVRRLLPTGSREDLVHVNPGEFGIGINCISVTDAFCMTGSDDGYLRLWPLDFSGVILEAGMCVCYFVKGWDILILSKTATEYEKHNLLF